MYTDGEIIDLIYIFDRYDVFSTNLNAHLREAVILADYDQVGYVNIIEQKLCFSAKRHGPYQSEDEEHYNFPISVLKLPVHELAILIVQEKAKRREERNQLLQEVELDRKKKLYEQLKKELGDDV